MLDGDLMATAVQMLAAMMAGALNAVAGGGSFLTFPSLMLSGLPPVMANATSTVVLWPGSAASAYAYRKDFKLPRRALVTMAAVSLLGGTLGALLLVFTPSRTFVKILPFLLLAATLTFTFGDKVRARLGAPRAEGAELELDLGRAAAVQLAISIYGGYFGGGMGFMMLAAFAVLGFTDIHQMNGLKNVLGVLLNGAAIVTFIAARTVAWGPAAAMVVAAVVGGYAGARLARRVDPKKVRAFVVCVGWAMTALFFYRSYRP